MKTRLVLDLVCDDSENVVIVIQKPQFCGVQLHFYIFFFICTCHAWTVKRQQFPVYSKIFSGILHCAKKSPQCPSVAIKF